MFISNDEKKYLFDQIKALVKEQSLLSSEITFLKGKLKATEGNIFVIKQELEFKKTPKVSKPKVTKSKAKKPKTEAQKAYQREYMRKYNARKKAEQLALEKK